MLTILCQINEAIGTYVISYVKQLFVTVRDYRGILDYQGVETQLYQSDPKLGFVKTSCYTLLVPSLPTIEKAFTRNGGYGKLHHYIHNHMFTETISLIDHFNITDPTSKTYFVTCVGLYTL